MAESNIPARPLGMTYGKYQAMRYEMERRDASLMAPPRQEKKVKKSKRRYTDEQAFALWQAGKNDCEIGAVLGVSRQIIQRWRDLMELPSTAKFEIDTMKYHLVTTPAGVFVICDEEL